MAGEARLVVPAGGAPAPLLLGAPRKRPTLPFEAAPEPRAGAGGTTVTVPLFGFSALLPTNVEAREELLAALPWFTPPEGCMTCFLYNGKFLVDDLRKDLCEQFLLIADSKNCSHDNGHFLKEEDDPPLVAGEKIVTRYCCPVNVLLDVKQFLCAQELVQQLLSSLFEERVHTKELRFKNERSDDSIAWSVRRR